MPVQFAPAVSRKPTAMVAMKPQSISCACQMTPANCPRSMTGANTHSATDTAAQKQPAKYNGRKPSSRNAAHCGAGSFTLPGSWICSSSVMARSLKPAPWARRPDRG